MHCRAPRPSEELSLAPVACGPLPLGITGLLWRWKAAPKQYFRAFRARAAAYATGGCGSSSTMASMVWATCFLSATGCAFCSTWRQAANKHHATWPFIEGVPHPQLPGAGAGSCRQYCGVALAAVADLSRSSRQSPPNFRLLVILSRA